ncbi:unnamed protein product, partial [Didymodactylos carnosus]
MAIVVFLFFVLTVVPIQADIPMIPFISVSSQQFTINCSRIDHAVMSDDLTTMYACCSFDNYITAVNMSVTPPNVTHYIYAYAPRTPVFLTGHNLYAYTVDGYVVVRAINHSLLANISGYPHADNMAYDVLTDSLYVAFNGSSVDCINVTGLSFLRCNSMSTVTGLPGVEQIIPDLNHRRLFVATPGNNSGAVAVVTLSNTTTTIKLLQLPSSCVDDTSLAYIDSVDLIYVVCRNPNSLSILRPDGTLFQSFSNSSTLPNNNDDLWFDNINNRLYISGNSFISSYSLNTSNGYLKQLQNTPADPTTRTSLWIPSQQRFYTFPRYNSSPIT